MSENASESMSNAVNVKAEVEYEAPVIESVVTPESIEREVQYAGTFSLTK